MESALWAVHVSGRWEKGPMRGKRAEITPQEGQGGRWEPVLQEAEGSTEPHPQAMGSAGNQHIVLPNSDGRGHRVHHQSDGFICLCKRALWLPCGDQLGKSKRDWAFGGTQHPPGRGEGSMGETSTHLGEGRGPWGDRAPTWERGGVHGGTEHTPGREGSMGDPTPTWGREEGREGSPAPT